MYMVRNSYHFKDLEIFFSSYYWTSCESEIAFVGLNEQISPFCMILKGITHTRAVDISRLHITFGKSSDIESNNKKCLLNEGDIGGGGGYPIPQNRKKKWQIPKHRFENRPNTVPHILITFITGSAYLWLLPSSAFNYLRHTVVFREL